MRFWLIICTFCLWLVSVVLNQASPVSYYCNVANCQSCSYINLCGVCNNNYILQINITTSVPYCQPIICNINNCQTCYQNNNCSVCNPGFYVISNGTCASGNASQCSSGCIACNNSTVCLFCAYGFNLLNGLCFPNNGNFISNCQSAFTAYSCQLCNPGYMVSPSYHCISNPGFQCNSITNCDVCNTTSSSINCMVCSAGYQLSQGVCTTLTCSVPNCQICNQTQCIACINNYYLNNNQCFLQVYQCNVSNCLYCKGANICGQCISGYAVSLQIQNTTTLGSLCIQITASVGGTIPVTNCIKYEPTIPGTSQLSIGCKQCQVNFINVGGYCVANLTQGNYTCNIPNCVYCIQNNVCGKCGKGYTAYLGSLNICIKDYSPLPNCILTPLNSTNCYACANGYFLVDNIICFPVPIPMISCNVPGCNFCTGNNACTECLLGYNLQNGTCTPSCTVTNCYQCNGTDCQICGVGYYLSNSVCVSIDNQPGPYCGNTFGSACTNCTLYACTQCSPGNTFNTVTNKCCQIPNTYNMAYCIQYNTQWSSTDCSYNITCTGCQLGAILTNINGGQCIMLPCNISNCSYCFQSSVCYVCKTGYTLVNNTCTIYNIPSNCTITNCISCNGSTNVCTGCLEGYVLFNGSCICNIQNCLSCQGSAFCTQCAYPTYASYSSSSCLPQPIPNTYCNVSNCRNCMAIDICAQCANGFTLQPNGSCSMNPCNRIANCALCSSNQNICYLCSSGYIQSSVLQQNNCVAVPGNYSCQVIGCTVCQVNNSNACQTCNPFYTNTSSGQCTPIKCVSNCIFCLVPNTCLICQHGYYYANNSNCNPINSSSVGCPGPLQSQNCIGCANINGTTVCIQCQWGLQPSQNQTACIPQTCNIPNCQLCLQNMVLTNGGQLCLVCEQGYSLNSYLQCIQLSVTLLSSNCSGIYNCLYCSSDDYCGYCAAGWNATNGVCVTSKYCSVGNCVGCSMPNVCVICSSNYLLTNTSTCTPVCNITYCQACSTPNVCSQCIGNLALNKNTCSCPDTTFIVSNNTCVCPVNATLSGTTCIGCDVQYCLQCSSLDSCAECSGNLTLFNNTCGCVDDTFVIADEECVCPSQTTLLQDTCISCNVTYCVYCQSANVCQNCSGNMTLSNSNTCICPDSTFNISNGICICPVNTTLLVNTCIQCNIAYCTSCSSPNTCQTCINNLTLSNNICGCASQQSITNSTCIPCNVSNCLTCATANYCGVCDSQFIVSWGMCVCPANSTLYGGNCVNCTVANCILCQSANVCTTCAISYTLLPIPSICVQCNVLNCLNCSSPNYCSTCSNNLVPNAQGNQCVNCNIQNCTLCQNNYQCALCIPGNQLAFNNTVCLACTLQGCSICLTSTQCKICLFGYSLLPNGLCILCLPPCLTCVAPTFCLNCVFPFSASAGQDGVCYSCNIPNCFNCSQANPNTCIQCQPNYALTSTNTCVYNGSCSQTCQYCLVGQMCQSCIPGFTLDPYNSKICIQCNAANCFTCLSTDTTICLTCTPGFYLQNGLCTPCPFSNCQTCTQTTCITYKQSTGQISVSYNNAIYPAVCDPGCAVCSLVNPANCITCVFGYTLNNLNICIPCSYPCLTCSYNAPKSCTSCFANSYLLNGNCSLCNSSSNCLLCQPLNTSQCLVCPSGFGLFNGVCKTACPPNCIYCSSSSVCLVCQSGYSVNSVGVCLPCLYNCRVCSGNVQAICLECGIGFYPSQAGTCISCSLNCVVCNYQGCISCGSGFYLNANLTCTQNCLSPCATCTPGTNFTCTSCLLGYTFSQSSNTCQPIVSCPSGICYQCPIGYIPSLSTCVQCGERCARCLLSNLSSCLSCKNGFYLLPSASTCTGCPQGCLTCSSGYSCLTCLPGYTLPLQTISNSSNLCVLCKLPCIQCFNSPSQCTVCILGYVLNGWNCQSQFNFGFNVSLGVNSSQFYNNYHEFLLALVDCLDSSINIQQVNMLSIVSTNNITNVSGIISTPQQSQSPQASDQYYSILKTLSGSIAGMPIQFVSVVVNGGTVLPQTTSNLGLILGICIPLSFIIISIIIYLVCVKKKNNLTPPSQYTTKDTTVRQEFQLNDSVHIQSSQ